MKYDRDTGESSRSITRGTTASARSMSLSNTTKYGGLIRLSPYKRFRNSLILTIMHIDQVVPFLQVMHSIVAFFRYIQFLAPAFLCCDSIIFQNGSIPYFTSFYFSILYRILPCDVSIDSISVLLFIYSGISVIFFMLYSITSIYYLKTAKITDQISNLLNVFIFTFEYLAHPIAGSLIGESLIRLIQKPEGLLIPVLAIVLAVICLLIHVYLQVYIFSHSIMFRPDSITFVHGQNNLILLFFTFCINLIIGVAINVSYIPKLVLFGITIGLYVLSYFYVARGPSFASQSQESIFMGCCISGVLCLTTGLIFAALKTAGEMIFISICIIVTGISQYIAFIISNRIATHYLYLLDELADADGEGLPSISLSHFLKMIVVGFRECHEQCSSFKVFHAGLLAWQDEPHILCLYAKFTAIYPDYNHQLSIIQNKLGAVGHHSTTAKMYFHQIGSTVDLRENVVTISLRQKMLNMQKKVNSAKRKLQSLWECIIQSNIPEMGKAIGLAYTACNNAELDLIKLKREFPNNSFVARGYLRFLLEVKHDVSMVMAEQDILKKLRMGQHVVMDRANELGINAFPHLPPSPNMADRPKADLSFDSDNTIDDDTPFQDLDSNIMILNKINKLHLPSVTRTIANLIGFTIILSIIPTILLISLNNYYINSIFEPITYMKYISLMRSLNFQMAACLLRISLEEMLPEGQRLVTQYPDGYYPENLNKSRKTREHFLTFIGMVGKTTEEINSMRDFQKGNEKIDDVKKIIFTTSIPYQFYVNNSYYTNTSVSGVQALMATALHCSRIADDEFNETLFNMTDFQNPRKNAEAIGDALSLALSVFDEFVINQYSEVNSIFLYSQISVSILIVIVYFVIVKLSLKQTQNETIEIYQSLISLPKNNVIKAADAIRVIKRSEAESDNNSVLSESNKQEENIVKLFMSANENTNANKLIHSLQVVFSIIIVIATLVSLNVVSILYLNQYGYLANNAPHIDYVMGTAAYIYGSILNIMTITLSQSFMQFDSDLGIHVSRFKTRIGRFRYYYNSLRYGGSSSTSTPFSGFEEAVVSAGEKITCVDEMAAPENLNQAYACYDAETQFIQFGILSRRVFEPFIQKNINQTFTDELPPSQDLKVENDYVNTLWSLGPIVLYDTFVMPLYDLIDQSILRDMKEDVAANIVLAIAMMLLIIFCIIMIILLVRELEKRIRFFVSLILHIETKVILSSSKIMSILNGNVMGTAIETLERGAEFYEEVVENMINGAVIVDESGKILHYNNFVKRNFLEEEENLVGKDISMLFNERFKGDVQSVIDKVKLEKIVLTYNNRYYHITKAFSKQNIILNIKDQTKLVLTMRMIAEENSKCELMLTSILPRALVPRVQKKEKNISFVVQSSSVFILNVANFSKWSSKKSGPEVMKMLNYIFKELDNVIPEFSLLTKIKVYGDCYMAAGGIFEDVNHPAAHAKQAVEFGLKAIEIVEKYNQENNENIQVRIGVNTGGPIVAGVLTVGRPTFEIIGPAISPAQELENQAVPMTVHISRSTYELVYGGPFDIKERGTLEINGQNIATYYVRQ